MEAQTVRTAACAVVELGEQSFALFGRKSAAISQILALFYESRESDGDGDEAEPISRAAAERAVDFVRVLPHDVPLPEFAWEPDGSISLDWIHSRHRLFSLSIGDGRVLPYAWLDGADRGHAVAFFDGETVPPRILEGIRRIMSGGATPIWAA